MVRFDVEFTEDEAARIQDKATREGIPPVSLLRRLVIAAIPVEREITDEDRRRALAAAGCFRSGLPDLASNHDAYLAEAYAGE